MKYFLYSVIVEQTKTRRFKALCLLDHALTYVSVVVSQDAPLTLVLTDKFRIVNRSAGSIKDIVKCRAVYNI